MFRTKLFKLFAWLAGGFVALLLVVLGVVYGISHQRLHRTYAITTRSIAIPTDAAALERGRHIVVTRSCADCHGQDFGGRKVIDDPLAGLFHGANLTRGQGGLAADYSDLDYVRAIRHGVSREGRPLALMPSNEYAALSDEDLGAVIAYLKSVPPVDRARGPVAPGPLVRLLIVLGEIKLAAAEIDHAASQPASVSPAISPEYGKYLAASCTGCHGSNLSGGKIAGAPPDWPAAANLTPHASARVGAWAENQFIDALRTRRRPDGSEMNPIMPAAIGQMTDLELKAIWSYIRTLPATPTGVR